MDRKPSQALLVALILASFTLMTLDYRGGSDSPVEPLRRAVGEAFGPAEVTAAAIVRPFRAIPDRMRTNDDLRGEVERLKADNADLKRQVDTTDLDRNRLAEAEGLLKTSSQSGYDLVPARVIGYGPAQSFSRTVTIDAGSRDGLHADMTVLNNAGLIGRILRVTRTTATVLLVVDDDSVVGGRLGKSMEIGFLKGRGDLGNDARLDLELIDQQVIADEGDVVTTWGSERQAPYVPGIRIGKVEAVYDSPRETSRRAVIEPFVDFSSLDLVGVAVPRNDKGRDLVKADGDRR